MFSLQTFLIFMAGAMALNLTPGPDMTFVLAQSAARGARAGVMAALGISLGGLIHMTMAVLGLAALLAALPLAFNIIRIAGAIYLAWIAITLWRHPPAFAENGTPSARSTAGAFRQGVLTNLFNPKVALFFLAFLPQFVVHGAVPAALQILILGLAFNISGTLVDMAVALCSGRIAGRLRRTPQISNWIGRISASVMMGLALRLAWPERG